MSREVEWGEAEQGLRSALAHYGECIDRKDPEALRDVFTTDCLVRYGDDEIHGFDALVAHLRKNLAYYRETKHVIYDIKANPDGELDGAFRFRSGVTSWHAFVKDRPSLTLHGEYVDTLERTPEGWRIAQHLGSELSREWGVDPPSRPPIH